MTLELKTLGLADCELKFADGGRGEFEGYLSVFGGTDAYGDTVIPGAFKKTLAVKNRIPVMLLNHDSWDVPIGVWQSMVEDETGLRVKGRLTEGNDQAARVYLALKDGAMTGMSMGYKVARFENKDSSGQQRGRNMLDLDLYEGSIVTMPADAAARIDSVTAAGDVVIADVRDLERVLRDAFSQKMAKRIISRAKDICGRDAPELLAEVIELKKQIDGLEGQLRLDSINSKIEKMKLRN